LGFDPAGSGVYRQDRRPLVVRAAEEPRHLLLLQGSLHAPQLLGHLAQYFFVALRQLQKLFGVRDPGAQPIEQAQPALGPCGLRRQRAGPLLVVPEIGTAHLLAQSRGAASQSLHVEEFLQLRETPFELRDFLPELRH
jgi:hypothetical protein